jgi:hypothetical protein
MEPKIIINGVELNNGQAMAVRAAITGFNHETANPTALGDDVRGRSITEAYYQRTKEVLEIIRS